MFPKSAAVRWSLIALLILVGVVVVFGMLTWSSEPFAPPGDESVAERSEPMPPPEPDEVLPVVKASPGAAATQREFQALAEELDEQLPTLLVQYDESTRYPPYSQPIDADQIEQYLPNRSTDVSAPFPLPNLEEPILLSLQLDRFQVFHGESVSAALSVAQVPRGATTNVRFVVKDLRGQEYLSFEPQSEGAGMFVGILDLESQVSEPDRLPDELLLQAIVTVAGESLLVAAPFRYTASIAEVVSVQPADIDGPDLRIPLVIRNAKPGYYFLGANLYSQTTGEPLLRLEGEGRLAGSGQLSLRAHGTALRATGDAGPYWLGDISLVRSAEVGESLDRAGKVLEERFPVEGFPLESYPNDPYQDPMAAERKAFLEKLGGL